MYLIWVESMWISGSKFCSTGKKEGEGKKIGPSGEGTTLVLGVAKYKDYNRSHI